MKLKSNALLLLAAAIWGFAFVAQRVGMDYVGPFTFNGVRFALGGVSLLPLLYYYSNRDSDLTRPVTSSVWRAGLVAGLILFVAASLQQIGLQYTSAGKAAFITCLYIILVPFAGVFLKQYVGWLTGFASALALFGLFLLCVKDDFTMDYGDFLELVGAAFWTAHILWIDYFARRVDSLKLAFSQFITCSLLSLGTAWLWEDIALAGLLQAWIPILYGGVGSVGIAYTLQIVGQKNASPTHAAIILSLETVFAALGGYLLLGERLGSQELFGCFLMMAGMVVSQLPGRATRSVS